MLRRAPKRTIERAVTVNVEAAHCDEKGRMHGHSYLIECWTTEDRDMPAFERRAREIASRVDHTVLETSIGKPSMERLAEWFMAQDFGYGHGAPEFLSRVIVRRPTLGYAVELRASA